MNETTDFNLWGYDPLTSALGVSVHKGRYPWQYGYTDDSTYGGSWGSWGSHRPRTAVKGLYREITGFQFAGAGQEVASAATPWFNATFELDPSVNVSGWSDSYLTLDPVPYNSTLWWNGSGLALAAPFLDLPAGEDDCSWFSVTGGTCLCYRGEVLMSDFRGDDNLICISEEGYVWGFSSVITLIGLILEVCWVVGCFGMWLDVHINSSLFRMNRRGSGVVRNILDVGGAIRHDLGRDTGAYGNGALLKELEKLPPVGYEVVDGDGRHSRISIVSMPGARRRGAGLKAGRLYA